MTEIAHKDGSTVKQSFGYTLDDDGTITRITHEDGSYWDYGYDGRNRLISADRKSQSGNIVAEYDYSYDDADNMLTKTEPFEDDFEDGGYTGWTLYSDWSASTKAVVNSVASWWHSFYRTVSDADFEVRFDYVNKDTSGTDKYLAVDLRRTASDDRVRVSIHGDKIVLEKYVSGVWSDIASNTSATTDEDETYHVRVECDGGDVTVWRWQEGELEDEILSSTTTITTTNRILFGVSPSGEFAVDNIRLLSDSLDNDYTFAYNTANELMSMTGPNGTTTFTYDDWGRQPSQRCFVL